MAKFENWQILLNKNSHRFLATTKHFLDEITSFSCNHKVTISNKLLLRKRFKFYEHYAIPGQANLSLPLKGKQARHFDADCIIVFITVI